MALDRIGIRTPEAITDAEWLDTHYVESTNMNYEIWRATDGRLFVGASNEDVGLVEWYYATQEDVDTIYEWQ